MFAGWLKKHPYILALAISLLFTGMAAAVPSFGETRITTNTAEQTVPDIYGNKIVWDDQRNGHWDIYMHDLATGIETPIATDTGGQFSPAIYGDKIVWEHANGPNSDLYMYDLAVATETAIATDTASKYYPRISGDKIVWADWRDGNADIYTYDLTAATETAIATGPVGQNYPDISGDKIVWQDQRNGNWDIYMYDLTAATETAITTNTANQYTPAIYGDKIVWEDSRNGSSDIYMYDLTSHIETAIATGPAAQYAPAIYGDKIVWQDDRNGSYDIYMYDLAAGIETPICTDSATQSKPKINGDKIVWRDGRNGNDDIYMFTLDIVAPSASMTAPKFSTDVSKAKSFTVFWDGADAAPSSGIASYDVQVKKNSTGGWANWRPATTVKSALYTGAPGNTYYFRARARDGSGNLGLWSSVKRTIVPYDQNTKITKMVGFGGTISKPGSNYYLGTARYSTTAGDEITYSFTGNYFALVGTKGPKFSKAVVIIDGVKKTIDAKSASKHFRQVLMEKSLTMKKHTVKIKNLGTAGRSRFEIDGLGVGK